MIEKALYYLNYPLLALGCLVSPILRILYPGVRYGYDVTTFVEVGFYANSIKDLYNGELFSNYPFIGLLSSTGLLKLLNNDIGQYLIALSFIDLINVILVYFILKNLNVKYSGIWSFVIAMIPSTWAGGAIWGQIDNIGQGLILAIVLTLCIFNRKQLVFKKFNFLLIIIGLLFSAALLTKQILLFSLLAIFPLIIQLMLIHTRFNTLRFLKKLLLFGVIIIAPIIVIDSWLNLPAENPWSHLQTVYFKGSEHMNKISGNGFNIWVLFFNDLLYDSSTTLFLFFSPKVIGLIIFSLVFIHLTYHFFTQNNQSESKKSLINFLWYLALVNLSFNIFLTGTHDRYLYHFYPFLIIAVIAAEKELNILIKNKELYIIMLGACLYGAFILSILLMIQPAYSNKLLAIFHFLLFVYLFIHFTSNKKQAT